MAISAARRAAACHRISSHLCALAPCERLPALSPHSRKRESGESGEGKGLGSRSRTRGVHRVCSKLRGLHSTVWHRLAGPPAYTREDLSLYYLSILLLEGSRAPLHGAPLCLWAHLYVRGWRRGGRGRHIGRALWEVASCVDMRYMAHGRVTYSGGGSALD